jgi:citrate lyase beta subunit
MDLEDAVAPSQKVESRSHIVHALNSWGREAKCERLVRINPVGSGLEAGDLAAILQAKVLPDGIVIPKVESSQHVKWVENEIVRLLGKDRAEPLILIALIESVLGMIHIREISTSSSRLRALIFGADDYRASVGAV